MRQDQRLTTSLPRLQLILSHVEVRRHAQAWNGEVWGSTVGGEWIDVEIDQLTEGRSGNVGKDESGEWIFF
jgi:hypothetical protein